MVDVTVPAFRISNRSAAPSRYAGRQRSPGALAAAIALNGGAVALLLAIPATQYVLPPSTGIPTRIFPLDPVPPPNADPVEKKPKPSTGPSRRSPTKGRP